MRTDPDGSVLVGLGSVAGVYREWIADDLCAKPWVQFDAVVWQTGRY